MFNLKRIAGLTLTIVLAVAALAVYRHIPQRITNSSDLADYVGHRVKVSGETTMTKLGIVLEFQGVNVGVMPRAWPTELSNGPETVVGVLQENSDNSWHVKCKYAIDHAVSAEQQIGVSEMLYESTLKPFFASNSRTVTVCILFGCVLIPMIPALIIAKCFRMPCRPAVYIGLASAFLAYGAIAISLGSYWLGHHYFHFPLLAKAIGVTSFASPLLFTCYQIVFLGNRTEIATETTEHHAVPRSTT